MTAQVARLGNQGLLYQERTEIARRFESDNVVTLYPGDCLELLRTMPDGCAQLVVTSPPYNIGKSYERKTALAEYLSKQGEVLSECVRILSPQGSLCWQVGNFVSNGSIVPLDVLLYPICSELGLRLRNRIVWHFEHGLHCSRRLSGRYETVSWYTKGDEYHFDVDPIRVPQKYPGKKYFKGPRAGEYSCHPAGKNPGDVWVIPNVKHNHVEKTSHPCQFPVELIERLVLSLTTASGLVVDPYMGVGSTAIAAVRHGRRAAGAEIMSEYLKIARERVRLEFAGALRTRPMGREVYRPTGQVAARPGE
ncbi:MAG: site-specific DNA-methyltransferase [Planctomyces sp.]|nr:site-specific DNA-methyltransferase [Planctomyces sp.]